MMNTVHEDIKERIYLPSLDNGVDAREYLQQYIDREFPESRDNGTTAVYSVPKTFQKIGEKQASLAEETVYRRFKDLTIENRSKSKLWLTFFHNANYAGHSFRNQRVGKLMIREHDYVVFAKFEDKHFIILIEVKSTSDHLTNISNLEKVSDAKIIKNNKRSAQHQLRDHMEILEGFLNENQNNIQCYITWPFLGAYTRDPKQQPVRRWKDEPDLHVFQDILSNQTKFNDWFFDKVLTGNGIEIADFITLLNRYIVMSCGVFVNEINEGMMALLTQEQLQLLNSNTSDTQQNKPLIVHGAAGTGKTLLVLRKLQQLYQNGLLNELNRALYICYWPGLRCEVELKLQSLGIKDFVDTARFFVSIGDFLKNNHQSYKHIFMDETEALCLAFDSQIIQRTLKEIYQKYHNGNCSIENCPNGTLNLFEDMREKIAKHDTKTWGELWFTVDINQVTVFLPKHSPQMIQIPHITLSKVMRSTGYIFNVFKHFYPMPLTNMLTKVLPNNIIIPNITIGHHINGPRILWTNIGNSIDVTVAKIIIDLCSTKGFKPNDICVLPFLVNEKLVPANINRYIDQSFVENSYRPEAVWNVEDFLRNRKLNNFLIAWALRVKGLEFKVVIMAIDDDDFDYKDSEDRKKAYVISSRCTSLLILITSESIRNDIDIERTFQNYPFLTSFNNRKENKEGLYNI